MTIAHPREDHMLDVERRGPIAVVTLNRPDAGNGVSNAMAEELAGIIERANIRLEN